MTLTCPGCGEILLADHEWLITDRSLIGTTEDRDLQGVYGHADCVEQ